MLLFLLSFKQLTTVFKRGFKVTAHFRCATFLRDQKQAASSPETCPSECSGCAGQGRTMIPPLPPAPTQSSSSLSHSVLRLVENVMVSSREQVLDPHFYIENLLAPHVIDSAPGTQGKKEPAEHQSSVHRLENMLFLERKQFTVSRDGQLDKARSRGQAPVTDHKRHQEANDHCEAT